MRLPLITLAAVAAAGLTVAHASEPSSGTVSNTSPKVEWGGSLASSGVTNNVWANDPSFACNPPACDSFALELKDSAALTIKLHMLSTNADGSDPGCGIRLIKPDGSNTWYDGSCSETTAMKVVVKAAPVGNYTIDVASSHVCCGRENYTASAEIPVPGGGATVPVPVTPTVPTSAPEVKLSAKVPTLSAKKLKKAKKFTATLTSNGALTNVNALLVSKTKKLGSGKLATLNGTAKMTVKVKKLKAGSYTLSVGGKDSVGRNVVATAKVKIKK